MPGRGYSQAACHGAHLPGGAALAVGCHRLLLAGSERRGQKSSVRILLSVAFTSHPLPGLPLHPSPGAPLGRGVLRGQEGSLRREEVVTYLPSGFAHHHAMPLPALPFPCHPLHPVGQRRCAGACQGHSQTHPSRQSPAWAPPRQPPLSPRSWPGWLEGLLVPVPCSKHLTLGLRAFPAGKGTSRAGSRAPSPLAHVLWAMLPSRELQSEEGQQSCPLLLLSPDQVCLHTSGWSRVQPGLLSWQKQLMAKPPPGNAWLLLGSARGFVVLSLILEPPMRSHLRALPCFRKPWG